MRLKTRPYGVLKGVYSLLVPRIVGQVGAQSILWVSAINDRSKK